MLTARALRPTLARLAREGTGASAVEFALVLPVMLTLWAGMVEMSHAIGAWRKVTLLSRTVADLTSQGDTVDPMSSTLMSDILGASTAVLRPYAASGAQIVVSALGIYGTSPLNPVVCSSAASSNVKARQTGIATDLSIPAGFGTYGNRYILAEVSMPYTPMIGGSLFKLIGAGTGQITLRTTFAWPVRNGFTHNSPATPPVPEVTLPSGSPCS